LQELSPVGPVDIEGARLKVERPRRRPDQTDRQERAADAEQECGGELCRPWPCGERFRLLGSGSHAASMIPRAPVESQL
jgi:hypothetical protein